MELELQDKKPLFCCLMAEHAQKLETERVEQWLDMSVLSAISELRPGLAFVGGGISQQSCVWLANQSEELSPSSAQLPAHRLERDTNCSDMDCESTSPSEYLAGDVAAHHMPSRRTPSEMLSLSNFFDKAFELSFLPFEFPTRGQRLSRAQRGELLGRTSHSGSSSDCSNRTPSSGTDCSDEGSVTIPSQSVPA